ncbi:MAG: hypothetical protein H6807_10830 [Planctomycetes bacterium]|nr:hypothetical protein [Planctomycetota bacterium]
MKRSQRPGGMTALGLLHFTMFVINAFSILMRVVALVQGDSDKIASFGGSGQMLVLVALRGLLCVSLVVNGVGLLRMSRVLGRFGSLFFLAVALADAISNLILAPRAFDIFDIAGLSYALMASGLVWTVFRRDFDHQEAF